jgi:recombination protein RecR
MAAAEIERLIRLLARLPGLGPRSARRAALAMLKRPELLLQPLVEALASCAATVTRCRICRNLDSRDPCAVCSDPERDQRILFVVEDVEDLWAMERAGSFRGVYHVLGGTLSAVDRIGPDELGIAGLVARVAEGGIEEVILGLSATVEGQTTAHYLAERLKPLGCRLTRLAQGVPVGGELEYLDEGTLAAALRARQPVT